MYQCDASVGKPTNEEVFNFLESIVENPSVDGIILSEIVERSFGVSQAEAVKLVTKWRNLSLPDLTK